jgi:hypothetical protein
VSRRGAALLAATVLAGGLALALPRLLSSGGGLVWTGTPQVYAVPGLSTDRVLSGKVVNTSGDAIYVDARKVAVVDRRGHRLETGARFLAAFAHPLYAPMQFQTVGDAFQLQRLGVVVRIEPGQQIPLTVSWRSAPGDAIPATVDLGEETLSIPQTA